MTTQKKYSLIAFAICLVLTITLLGCKKGMAISKDDALEVALDYSGFSQEEIQNPTVTEQEDGNKGFLVTFGTPSGDFECVISPKGIMQAQYYSDGRYGKDGNDDNNGEDATDGENGSNEKGETDETNGSQSNNVETDNESEPNSKPNPADENDSKAEANNEKDSQSPTRSESDKEDSENKSDNDHNNQPNRTPEEEAALNLALQNVGAEEGDVENISIHPSGSNIEIRFKYGESTNIVTVNPATNSVVSTVFE
ncbi:hypothetical protein IM774_07435 [Erysipelotrichaceae bacterium RD49]|nr:hypothetical protein [Erysipelotrichaceae bacterium RD49]